MTCVAICWRYLKKLRGINRAERKLGALCNGVGSFSIRYDKVARICMKKEGVFEQLVYKLLPNECKFFFESLSR